MALSQLLILVLMAVVWSGIGFLIARYGFKIRELLILLPASLGIGTVFHAWLLNIFLKLFDTLLAAWLVTVLGLAVAGILYWRNRADVRSLEMGVSPRMGILLLLLWVLTSIGFFAVATSQNVFDEVDHGPRATMIAQTGLSQPSRSYANRDFCINYHYMENAVVGTLSRQAGIHDLKRLADYRIAFNMVAVVGLCFGFLWTLLKRQNSGFALLGTFLFLTISPGLWLTEIPPGSPVSDHLPDGAVTDYVAFVSRYVSDDFLGGSAEPYLHTPDLIVPLVEYMETPNPPGFWVGAFLALLGWLHLNPKNRLSHLGLGLVVAHTALSFETGMPLIAVPIGLSLVIKVWQSRPDFLPAVQNLLLYSLTALAAMVLQGGVITDTLFCEPLGEYYAGFYDVDADASLAQFEFTGDLAYSGGYYGYQFAFEPVEIWKPQNWPIIFIDWGLGLFLYPVILVHALIRRRPYTPLIFLTGLALIVFTLLFRNSITPTNNYRIALFPIWMGGALSIFLWRDLWRWNPAGKLIVVACVLILGFPGAVNGVWFAIQPSGSSGVLTPLDYTVQEAWYGKLDPVEDSVFDPSLDINRTMGVARSIMVFGTYAHHAFHANSPNLPDPRLAGWRQHLLPGDLGALGYDYLYFDDAWWNSLIGLQQQRISNPEYYTLIEEWVDAGSFRRLYQVVGQQTLAAPTPFASYFSPENQRLFETYTPSLPLDEDALVFNPRNDTSVEQQSNVMQIVEAIESTRLSREERSGLFDLMGAFEQMQFEVDLPDTVDYRTGLLDWRNSKLPDPLRELSVDYLMVDQEWYGWLLPEEANTLNNPDYYQLVREWPLPETGEIFRLYRVVD